VVQCWGRCVLGQQEYSGEQAEAGTGMNRNKPELNHKSTTLLTEESYPTISIQSYHIKQIFVCTCLVVALLLTVTGGVITMLQFGSSLVNSIEPSYLCVRLLSSVGEYLRIIISIPC
jgi:hypothetical protein